MKNEVVLVGGGSGIWGVKRNGVNCGRRGKK